MKGDKVKQCKKQVKKEMPQVIDHSKILSNKANQSTGAKRVWLIILLGSLSAFGPLSLDMYLPALPKLTSDYNTSSSLVPFLFRCSLLYQA
jgi:hypothetical protein